MAFATADEATTFVVTGFLTPALGRPPAPFGVTDLSFGKLEVTALGELPLAGVEAVRFPFGAILLLVKLLAEEAGPFGPEATRFGG